MSDSNIFLLTNLGSEMIYIIYERLKAQNICLEKSATVIRDITNVLFDFKFLDRIIIGSQQQILLTPEHCRIILYDIACCSLLMQLDDTSMGKLWDLMTMAFKWQLSVGAQPERLLDITFRHLDGVSRIYADDMKASIVGAAKNNIVDFWNSRSQLQQSSISETIVNWLKPYETKISILIRLGLQDQNGLFNSTLDDVPKLFAETPGENIYSKSVKVLEERKDALISWAKFRDFEHQLSIAIDPVPSAHKDSIGTINLLLGDKMLNKFKSKVVSEIVELSTVHHNLKKDQKSWETIVGKQGSFSNMNLENLLDLKL